MKPMLEPTATTIQGETALRVLVLGAAYAIAVLFAVVFSPSMGFVSAHGGLPAHIAAAGQPATIAR